MNFVTERKKIVHLIDQLTIGGLERIIANFVCASESSSFDNIIVSIRKVDQSTNIMPESVKIYSLFKQEGYDLKSHLKLYSLLKKIQPDIIHTYNLPSIEYHPISWLAGVKGHIHAEHGRDVGDPQGLNGKHNLLRKLMSYFIHKYVSVSDDLHQWLVNTVGISENKAILIQNGINTERFNLEKNTSEQLQFTIVARISPVKDHQNLLSAFKLLKEQLKSEKMPRLVIVGAGQERGKLEQFCSDNQLLSIEFLGARDDIEVILAKTDVFVLSSIAEGIPMTILEAMSASTPIVATNVGGIPEVVESGHEGYLVEKSNAEALALAIKKYIDKPDLIAKHGKNARAKVLNKFNEKHMVQAYIEQYQALVKG